MMRHILTLGIAAAAIFAIHLLSCSGIPLPWQDEVHILEMGRNVLEGIDGSAFAAQATGRNTIPFYFLGPLIQETFYRIIGFIGPRLSSMLGLMIATFFFYKWLYARSLSSRHSVLMAMFFLLNGLLTHSVRLVRVDSWAFACLYAALTILVLHPTEHRRTAFFICGLLCGVNLFIWPSSFLFLPFILSELLVIWASEHARFPRATQDCLFLGTGLALSSLCLLAISPCGIINTLSSYYSTANNGVISGRATVVSVLSSCIVAWGKELTRDPFFISAALVGIMLAVARRQFSALVLMVLTFAAMIPSGLHTYRLVYLWPFLFCFASDAATYLATRKSTAFRYYATTALAYAVWTFSVSYLVLSLLNPRTSHRQRTQELAHLVGTGSTNTVYSLSFQTYYAGRELGWRQFRFSHAPDIFNKRISDEILNIANTVIIHHEPSYYAIEEDVSPFGIIRNLMITAARKDDSGNMSTAAGKLGALLAFSAESPAQLSDLRRRLINRGFRCIGRLGDTQGHADATLFTVLKYDDLEIWKLCSAGDQSPSPSIRTNSSM